MKRAITVISSIAVVCLWVFMMFSNNTDEKSTLKKDGEMMVHYIDVGQGDCAFIELSNNKTMLIDAGEKDDCEKIENYIENLGYSFIDYMILTHPHADHIGSAEHIIRKFDIGKIYMPDKESNSAAFENMLDAISDKGYMINEAKAGVNILSDGELDIDIISPAGKMYESTNDYSSVVKLEYKDTSFIFMGDAEAFAEREILYRGESVDCDVIKIGHHGSSTSSSEEFIKAVSPEIAVISLGKDNSYGHPHREVKNLLKKLGIDTYRTDELGDIIISSDGESVWVE